MRLTTLRRHWDALGQQDPLWAILTSEEKKNNQWTIDEFLRTGRDEVAALMEYLERRSKPSGRQRALDFGCGVGRVTHALAEHFDEVIGVDIAASMIQSARELHRDTSGLTFVVNTSTRLEGIDSDSVDLVYSRLVLQHMHPRYIRMYLAEFVRVLRPAGTLVFQLPSDEPAPVAGPGLKNLLPQRIVTFVRACRDLTKFPRMEIHGLSRVEVERLLTAQGARVIDVVDDRVHGADTPGYRYCAVKAGSPYRAGG